jgi:hypothetical protein
MLMIVRLFHLAVETIDLTALASMLVTLKLERGVTNAILVTQHGLQLEQDRRAFIEWQVGGLDMSREGIHPACDTPNMHVMDVAHLWNVFHIIDECGKVDIFRSSI